MPSIFYLILFSGQGFCFEAVHLKAIQGKVDVDHGSGFKAAETSEDLKFGDKVRTGAGSAAVIEYPDGTKLKLNAGSTVALKGKKEVDLLMGALFAKVAKQVANQNQAGQRFTVQTPSAAAGVRGTEFFTTYGSGKKKSDAWLCVHEGEVEVTAENSEPVVVRPGFGIIVEAGKQIAPPKKYGWTEKLNWNMDPSHGEWNDKTSLDSIYLNPLKYNYE